MTPGRYTAAAILLHWTMALFIGANVLLGWWMHEAIDDADRQAMAIAAFQIHKSIGLTILVLSLVRLGLRLRCRPPVPPAGTSLLQRRVSMVTHGLFYVLMIAIPLSGWILVSSQWRGAEPLVVPTLWFGLFEVPHLPGLNELRSPSREAVWVVALEVHELLVIGTLALLALHVGAALKHRFVDGDGVLQRMWTLGASDDTALRRWTLRSGYAALALLLCGVVYQLFAPAAVPSSRSGSSSITTVDGSQAVLPAASHIHFAGTHAGTPFEGVFTRWEADISIDPAQPAASSITVVVDTASATDGVPLHDETLPGPEWFDVDAYPTAVYESTEIRADGEGYLIDGRLTIKKNSIDVPGLRLGLEGDRAVISGSVDIDRGDVNMGMESDPRGRWVGRNITVTVRATVVVD